MKEKKTKPYINNSKLYGVMQGYHSAVQKAKAEGTQLPRIPNYVGECFLLICNKLSTRGNFVAYSYRDEMISDAIENCVTAVDSFDPNKSKNPFAYFTQIAWFAFIRRITKEKKQTAIKHLNARNNEFELYDQSLQSDNNEYTNKIISEFEEKMNKTKKPKKKAKSKILGDEVE